MAAFRKALQGEPYDAVVDTQGLLKSALITRFASGTKHGMDRASVREPLAARFYDRTHFVARGLHAVERNRRLTAAALGIAMPSEIDYGLRANGGLGEKLPASYSVLLTMTSRADKLWPEQRWIELGHALGAPAILAWGSEEERARAERISRAIGGTVLPRKSVEELARVFAAARAVVGLDTGLTHLAAALGVPAVGIFCGSDPRLTGLFGAPYARNAGAPGEPPSVQEVLQLLG